MSSAKSTKITQTNNSWWWRPFFSAVALVVSAAFLHYDLTQVPSRGVGGRLKYLTVLNHLFVTTFYGGITLMIMSVGANLPSIIERIFMVLLTFSSVVCIAFWIIFSIDRELIFPARAADVYPPPLNYFQHGGLGIVMWIDLLTVQHSAGEEIRERAFVLAYLVAYFAYSLALRVLNGTFPYPLQEKLNVAGHIFLALTGASLLMFTCSWAQWLRRWRWPPSPPSKPKKE